MIVPAYARSSMMVAMRFLPYARGKEGTGSAFFETPLSAMDFKFVAAPVFLSLFLGWRGLLLNLFFATATVALICLYRKKLAGITGDLLGAMTEILEAVLFLAVGVGCVP
jgi:adenosylcobinamide-GDP ribazoletransferase